MKSVLIILVAIVLLASVVMAGEKEELQWKARALISEFNAAQQQLPQFKALDEFIRELDKKGFELKNGVIVEKPKPQPPKIEEPKKEPKK